MKPAFVYKSENRQLIFRNDCYIHNWHLSLLKKALIEYPLSSTVFKNKIYPRAVFLLHKQLQTKLYVIILSIPNCASKKRSMDLDISSPACIDHIASSILHCKIMYFLLGPLLGTTVRSK